MMDLGNGYMEVLIGLSEEQVKIVKQSFRNEISRLNAERDKTIKYAETQIKWKYSDFERGKIDSTIDQIKEILDKIDLEMGTGIYGRTSI